MTAPVAFPAALEVQLKHTSPPASRENTHLFSCSPNEETRMGSESFLEDHCGSRMPLGYLFVGLSPLLCKEGVPLPPCSQPEPGLALRTSLPTDFCSRLSSSVSFPSSDSDSEGDNPEKKKLQEQLMGKRVEAPWQWEGDMSGSPGGSGLGVDSLASLCRCHRDGEAQHSVE